MMSKPIFAQPVFVSKLENINDQEVDFINKQKKCMNKGGNYSKFKHSKKKKWNHY